MRIALVHDYLAGYGGAERVLEILHEIFPQAPIYTSFFIPRFFGPHRQRVEKWPIRTSWLQKFPFKASLISPFRLVAPAVFKRIDLSRYDLVIVSATGAYSPNLVKTGKKTTHLCYCHTPPRYLYGYPTARNWQKYWWGRVAGGIANHFLRIIDFESAQKVDYFIANSEEVASRIRKFYRRETKVIYPPIDIKKFKIKNITPEVSADSTPGVDEKGNYFLAGGRLARAKKIDIAVQACTELSLPLKVFGRVFAGYGEELKKIAGPTVEFLGEVPDRQLASLFARCRAFIFCADQEDFGMTPVEVMAAGRPVVAYCSGGVKETVIDGKTGVFFDKLTVKSLAAKLKRFKASKYKPKDCRHQAEKFNQERFKKEIKKFIKRKTR